MHYLLISFLCFCPWFGSNLAFNRTFTQANHPSSLTIRHTTDKGSFQEEPTVIYIVRHAEKVTTDPSNQDPDLSHEGYERAKALRKLLQRENITAAFITPYRRTRLTLAPLTEAKGIPLQIYQPHDYQALVETIRHQYAGQAVVVVGHSNSVLEIIEAFGAKRPVKTLTDQDYDYLFKVTIPKRGKSVAKAEHYGAQANALQR